MNNNNICHSGNHCIQVLKIGASLCGVDENKAGGDISQLWEILTSITSGGGRQEGAR